MTYTAPVTGMTLYDKDDDGNIPAILERFHFELRNRMNLTFSNTGARDLAMTGEYHPSRLSPNGGLRCWITNRYGWCVWTTTGWIWEPQRNLLHDWSWAGPAIVTGSDGYTLTETPVLSLPPGLRIVSVDCQANAEPFGASGGARLWVDGAGCNGVAQQPVKLTASGNEGRDRVNLGRHWGTIKVSGNQIWRMRCLFEDGFGGDGQKRVLFRDMKLEIIDHGPVD